MRNVIADLLDRFADFRDRRWRLGRLWISGEAITLLLVVGTLLTLGIFTATIATRSSSGGVGFSDAHDSVTGGLVTQMITREGKTVRVIRHRTKAGEVVFETVSGRGTTLPGRSVTLPARTVRETRTLTVTTREITTVTAIQPVTVTVFETVTVAPGPP
jgi:hypothetical protein